MINKKNLYFTILFFSGILFANSLQKNENYVDNNSVDAINFNDRNDLSKTPQEVGENKVIISGTNFLYDASLKFEKSDSLVNKEKTDQASSLHSSPLLITTTNDLLEAVNDNNTTSINTSLNAPAPGVLSNDTFTDEDAVVVVSYTFGGTTYNVGETGTTAAGSFTLFPDGSYTFVPAAGFTGDVPPINYTISEGDHTSQATLFIIVVDTENLIRLGGIASCNQGFTPDGFYKIRLSFNVRNSSLARDYHPPSLIRNIQITQDFAEIYGAGCIVEVENLSVNSPTVLDFNDNPYPTDFNADSINEDFIEGTSDNLFTNTSVGNAVLYPRQRLDISFCLIIDPFCDGRPNPTPSGSGIDFEPTLEVTSSAGEDDTSILLEDFHTTEGIITAGLFIPENTPDVNPDGTFDYVNSVVITNQGNGTANNVNFNLGLGQFLDSNINFNTLEVSQASGPPVNVNPNYDGDIESLLLLPGNSLEPGETIVLEIFHIIDPINFSRNNNFFQLRLSQTQGILDGFDENAPENIGVFSYATWEDNLGEHLDVYYPIFSLSDPLENDQCGCNSSRMSFVFDVSTESSKEIVSIDPEPDGILENEEITFQLTITNTSPIVQLTNIELQDNLNEICNVDPVSFTAPEIVSSTATENPILNANYDGITDIQIFDGSSGLLNAGESVTVEISVIFSGDCTGQNSISFSGTDPIGNTSTSSTSAEVEIFLDSDSDGIPDINDIDDDNDTILDTEESNGLEPLDDADGDFIPDYRDADFGPDINNDGIVDSFDFDGDGVPNHFDLDADNDGIFDILEVNNQDLDTDSDGLTNNPVGQNGLDDTVETDDTFTASVTYNIADTDNDTNSNYKDIDADGDGIVDNIEAQTTDNYLPPDNTIGNNGVDTGYPNGLFPIDTDEDGIFDYVDINSDNDFREDVIEGWDFDNDGAAETNPTGTDTDNDGLDDGFDNNINQINPTNGQVPTDFPNVDNEETEERDWREIRAIALLISEASAQEGEDLSFIITLVQFNDNSIPVVSSAATEITLFTTDGSPEAGEFNIAVSSLDYSAVNDIDIVIPPLTGSFEFTVPSLDDNISEQDEQFTLNANITSDNIVNSEAEGVGTILDNEPLPTVSLNDDIVNEGEDLVYNISLDIPSSTPVEINLISFDDTATSPDDYTPIDITIVINATEDPANPVIDGGSFNITTLLDNLNEPNSELLFVLGNVTSNNVSNPDLSQTGTILDLNPDPLVVITDDEVVEGSELVFVITLVDADGQPMANQFPIDFELETKDITATANFDYIYFNEFNFIPPGDSTLTIQIPTINDNLNEINEFMNLSATIISGAVSNSSNVVLGLGTIRDNDIPNLFTPNNDGQSEVFRIGNLENYPDFKLIIFDRWGSEIYNYSNNGNLSPIWWDGTKDGNPVIEGVYFYELDYNDGVTKPKTGFIQLAR